MVPELGLIEGFFGRPWTWEERERLVSFLADHGFRFYLYAPKADPYLRRTWQTDHPGDQADALARFADTCRQNGVRFGIGLSPYELYLDFDGASRTALNRKLAFLDGLGIDDLAILFDDMRGDLPDLALRQAEIIGHVAERSSAGRLIVCPSYYTDDPVLDRVFGQRPDGYLEDLGSALDPKIEIMWTGEKVCSPEIGTAHLERVAESMRRKPFLWDNYPVNDGPRMSPFLHLRAFTGRNPEIAGSIAAHGINTASQATLSCIPALTLSNLYIGCGEYDPEAAFHPAAEAVVGAELARLLEEDLERFQDRGLDGMEPDEKKELRERYSAFDHPAAREVVAWLNDEWRIGQEEVLTQ